MAKRLNPEPDDKEQSQRFIDTAKQLEADESGKLFEKATRAVIPPKKKKRDKQKT